MIVGTTPTHSFNIPFNTDIIMAVRIVYSQNDSPVLIKTTDECVLEDKTISTTLTQEDTFKFDHKLPVEIQVRVLTNTGTSLASVPKKIGVTKCLETAVIE